MNDTVCQDINILILKLYWRQHDRITSTNHRTSHLLAHSSYIDHSSLYWTQRCHHHQCLDDTGSLHTRTSLAEVTLGQDQQLTGRTPRNRTVSSCSSGTRADHVRQSPMVLMMGFEPTTYALPRRCATSYATSAFNWRGW